MFTLNDTSQIACHGTFRSVADAKIYAISLQEFGLCMTYMILQYTKEGHIMVYDSKSELLHGGAEMMMGAGA